MIKQPNILITGTPGTGKSSTCSALVENVRTLRHVQVNELVKKNGWHSGFDEERNSYIIDEDKVCDELEEILEKGGGVVESHAMLDYFPERWFDLVIVLVADNTVLFDRLKNRGYAQQKVQENVECEIMQVILQEVRSSYKPEITQVLASNTPEELENNVDRITAWYHAYMKNQESG
mmetsp:Transcript_1875/g.2160  ORF Transcript_1875/g.2160 Transcript_1875/m.2160 type:complete len:177 (+) Transcript_1875:81-611(+)